MIARTFVVPPLKMFQQPAKGLVPPLELGRSGPTGTGLVGGQRMDDAYLGARFETALVDPREDRVRPVLSRHVAARALPADGLETPEGPPVFVQIGLKEVDLGPAIAFC